MAIEIEVSKHPDYLHYLVSGSIEPTESSTDCFVEMIFQCQATDIYNILLDFRNIPGQTIGAKCMEYFFELTGLHEEYLKFGGTPIRTAFLGVVRIIDDESILQEIAAKRRFPAYVTTNNYARNGCWNLELP